MVIALIGSLFCLSISRSQCEYITSSESYLIFGITATKTQRGWQAFSLENRTHRRGSSIQNLKRGKIQLLRGVVRPKVC